MFLQLLLSTVIVIKASTVVPATADLLNETFDNATNYDDATWTATVASSGVVDPNETVLCPASGTGWGSECLQMNTGAANRKAYVMNDLGSARADAIYTTYHLYLDATMTAWDTTDSHIFMGGTTLSSAIPSASSPFVGTLEWDADGVEGGESNCATGANLPACWRLRMRIGAGTSRAPELTQAVKHTVCFLVDNGSAVGSVWLDGTQYLSVEQTSADVQFVWAGVMEFSPDGPAGTDVEQILMDNVKVSTGGCVD
jgi:hypothetical protein